MIGIFRTKWLAMLYLCYVKLKPYIKCHDVKMWLVYLEGEIYIDFFLWIGHINYYPGSCVLPVSEQQSAANDRVIK